MTWLVTLLETPTYLYLQVGTSSMDLAPPLWAWIAMVVILNAWRPVMRKIRR